MKKIIIKILIVAAVIAVVATIFKFSAQQSAQSDNISEGFTMRLLQIYHHISGTESADLMKSAIKFNGIVRKYAHFTIYSVLGILSMLMFGLVIFRKWSVPAWVCAMIFCIIYASCDEFHQWFVPGRSAEVRDVIIDSCGALWSSLLVFGIGKFIAKRINHNKKSF